METSEKQTFKTSKELDYSRPLDVHKWSDYPEVNSFVDTLWDEYLTTEFPVSTSAGKRPKTSTKKQFKTLLLDLFVAWKEDPDLVIGVSLKKGHYKTGSRYNALHISYKIVEVVHYLERLGLIHMYLGSEEAKRTTRIWPSEKLITIFAKTEISPLMVRPHEDKEVIVLSGKEPDSAGNIPTKSKEIEYKDDEWSEIPRLRSEVQKYNELLRQSFIDIGHLEHPVIKDEYWDGKKRRLVDRAISTGHFNKQVRRIFYRGSWDLGGRYHGGFWQQIAGEMRKNILINDFRTVELDFSGLHINVAYALEGASLELQDPYEVPLLVSNNKDEQRKWVKSLALMAFNAAEEKKAFQAFRSAQPKGSLGKRFTDNQLEQLLTAFKEKHTPIKKYLCSDKGVEFMNIDGRIAAKVINYFTDKQEPILCVHDSFICREQFKDELTDVMNKAVQEELQDYQIRIDPNKEVTDLQNRINKGVLNVTSMKDLYRDRPVDTRRTEGYLLRWNEHKYWLHMIENPIYVQI